MGMVREHNTETGEIIDRPMTTEELAVVEQMRIDAAAELKARTEAEAKAATAKAAAEAKLAALGLTADDLRALGL